ncbi:MAG TPA: hypothetical protein PLV96_01645 [Methanoregulaceae archaeon]|nr:hypothetical protein [Methanoregulaceae archaeon]HQA79481.1 hypothetical protein [Methanoregulaceae archaeon]
MRTVLCRPALPVWHGTACLSGRGKTLPRIAEPVQEGAQGVRDEIRV